MSHNEDVPTEDVAIATKDLPGNKFLKLKTMDPVQLTVNNINDRSVYLKNWSFAYLKFI